MVLYLQPEKNKLKSMSRSTFKFLFYVNKGKEKDGIVPVKGRITINGHSRCSVANTASHWICGM